MGASVAKKKKKINCEGCWAIKKDKDKLADWDHEHVIYKVGGERCPCPPCEKKRTCKRRCKKFYEYARLCKYHS